MGCGASVSADSLEVVKALQQDNEDMRRLLEASAVKNDIILASISDYKVASKGKKKAPCLGVIRLDYQYPVAEGDIDCPASFGYDVKYRVIPGLTFQVAQDGVFDDEVDRRFAEGIKYLEHQGVSAITGDCGFMMAFQVQARKIASKPVFMSSMVQCPVIAAAFEPSDHIMVMTANGDSLRAAKAILLNDCGFDVNEDRFKIVGCQDIPGFDAVAKGEAVPLDLVQPGICKLAREKMQEYPAIRAILLECTELPPYADALRACTGLPVFDAITGADFYVNGFKDNPRFGISDWIAKFDGKSDDYVFGQNLDDASRADLIQVPETEQHAHGKFKKPKREQIEKLTGSINKLSAPKLGVVRLDYSYEAAKGDTDHPASFGYTVLYRCVPGLTFDLCKTGEMPDDVKKEFKAAILWLEKRGASCITGDCGFMMAYQPIAREVATVPVFMSSMVQCPMLSVAFDKYDKILILTAKGDSLREQKEDLLLRCGFQVDDQRFIIQGCQDVPGFDAVAKGEKVDVEKVTPGIVKMTKEILAQTPSLRCILLECTELPPYADSLRHHTGLPVFDAITCADFFISARKDNPRFGLNQWQCDWDGIVDEYKLGDNLTEAQREMAVHVGGDEE